MCFTNRTVNNCICSVTFFPSCTSVTSLKGAPSAPVAGVYSSQVGKKEKERVNQNIKNLNAAPTEPNHGFGFTTPLNLFISLVSLFQLQSVFCVDDIL